MYLREFSLNWQTLMSACVGLALGSALSHYTTSLFGPALIAQFGWSKAQFALLGSLPLLTMPLVPFAGAFVDRFGPRVAATIGFVAVPLGFLAYAMMSGSIIEFFTIYAVQHVFGILTTSMVFCRIVVERFETARGLALSVVMSAPPLAGAIAAPVIGSLVESEGWRAGYFALAAVTATGGLIAVMTMGRAQRGRSRPPAHRVSRQELVQLLRHPTTILILIGMFLVNVPQVFASSQLKLIVMDSGISSATATWMMSLYAMGVIIGRFLSGLALDRVEAHYVAIAALGLPAIGYLVFASDITAPSLLYAGMLTIGLAQGAESDIGAYLISKRFDLRNFSLLLSLLTAMIGIGGAAGSLILSVTQHQTGSYAPFLVVSAIATLAGAVFFGLTGTDRAKGPPRAQPVEEKLLEQGMAGEIG